MIALSDVLIKPIISEKTMDLAMNENAYTFQISARATICLWINLQSGWNDSSGNISLLTSNSIFFPVVERVIVCFLSNIMSPIWSG